MSTQTDSVKRVVFVIADERFRDEELMILLRVLESAGVATTVASRSAGLCRGMLGGTATATLTIDALDVSQFDAIVVIGGAGCLASCDVSAVHVRLRDAMAEGRIVGAIGEAVVLAAKAGIVARRKVAVPADDRAAIRQAGGIVASGSVAVDDTLVTADGHSATTDFAQALRRRLAAKHGNGGSSR